MILVSGEQDNPLSQDTRIRLHAFEEIAAWPFLTQEAEELQIQHTSVWLDVYQANSHLTLFLGRCFMILPHCPKRLIVTIMALAKTWWMKCHNGAPSAQADDCKPHLAWPWNKPHYGISLHTLHRYFQHNANKIDFKVYHLGFSGRVWAHGEEYTHCMSSSLMRAVQRLPYANETWIRSNILWVTCFLS